MVSRRSWLCVEVQGPALLRGQPALEWPQWSRIVLRQWSCISRPLRASRERRTLRHQPLPDSNLVGMEYRRWFSRSRTALLIAAPAIAASVTHGIAVDVDGDLYYLEGAPDGPGGAADIPGRYWCGPVRPSSDSRPERTV